MANIKKIIVQCPKCKIKTTIELKKALYKFIILRCVSCNSNIVYYGNKMSIISDDMVKNLRKEKKLRVCGNTFVSVKKPVRKEPITKEDLLDLKILLETEKDFNKFLSKL